MYHEIGLTGTVDSPDAHLYIYYDLLNSQYIYKSDICFNYNVFPTKLPINLRVFIYQVITKLPGTVPYILYIPYIPWYRGIRVY